MNQPIHNKRTRVIGWTIILVLIITTAEVSSLIFLHSAPPLQEIEDRSLPTKPTENIPDGFGERFTIHPYIGFVRKPLNAKERSIMTHGFPHSGTGVLFPQDDTVYRIGIFGGSVAHQFYAAGGKTLRDLLRDHPTINSRTIRLQSMAAGSYKQPQQVMALNYLLSQGAHFDMIITLDGLNEVAISPNELRHRHTHPSFPAGWRWRTESFADPELTLEIGQLLYMKDLHAKHREQIQTSPLYKSATMRVIAHLRLQNLQQSIANLQDNLDSYEQVDNAHLFASSYDDRGDDMLMEDITETWKQSTFNMHSIAKARGIPSIHFLQPNQYVEGSKPLSREEKRIAFVEDHRFRHSVMHGYPLIEKKGAELAENHDVAFVSLSMIFAKEKRTLYYDDCCHFNALGNEIMAEKIAAEITERL